MAKNWNWWSRKLHRWGAILTLLPMLLVIISGLLLQVKKQVTWVQPKTVSGAAKGEPPVADWRSILDAASGVKEAEISSWDDVDRLDVRPGKGVVKVQSKNSWEVQVDLSNAEVLTFNFRRSDWIEGLHDGSYFSDHAKLWVFLPNGLILLGLWGTGLWLLYLPFSRRKKNAK